MHGYTGPLKVSYGGWFSNVGKDYLEVGPKYEKREVGDDGNGPFELNKYAVSYNFLLSLPSLRLFHEIALAKVCLSP